MLLNLSNHPKELWPEAQLQAAEQQFGSIQDLPFPQISPYADEEEVQFLAYKYLDEIQQIGTPEQVTVHIMGEMNFTYAMVQLLKQNGYTCVASTTRRIVDQVSNDSKLTTFQFVRFRRY